MSEFDRHSGTQRQDRERNWREQDRSRGGIGSSNREDRSFARRDDKGSFFSNERGSHGSDGSESDRAEASDRDGRYHGPDRERSPLARSNQPGRLSGGGSLSRDAEDRSDRARSSGRSEREHYGDDDDKRRLPIDETEQLIASNKVEGTPVYGREGERLGTIYNFMVDKYSGRVTYAVMGYGGFLGVGQRYYPLPWRILDYDKHEGGYRIDMDTRDMERAPSFSREDEPRFNRDYGRRVHEYYGLDY